MSLCQGFSCDSDERCCAQQAAAHASQLDLVRRYLLACTARDAGIIIALGWGSDKSAALQREGAPGAIEVPETNPRRHLLYHLTLIDLDRKASWKIPKHLDLDLEIVEAARRSVRCW